MCNEHFFLKTYGHLKNDNDNFCESKVQRVSVELTVTKFFSGQNSVYRSLDVKV